MRLGDLQQATSLYRPTYDLLKEVALLFQLKNYASFGTRAAYVDFVERFTSSLESLFRSFHLFVHSLLSQMASLEIEKKQLKQEKQHLSSALEVLGAVMIMLQQKSNAEKSPDILGVKNKDRSDVELTGAWKTSFDREK